MTLFFIAWGNYPGFKDALMVAQCRAKCPIIIRTDMPPNLQKLFEELKKWTWPERALGIVRWAYLYQLVMETGPAAMPCFMADWDMLMCSPLEEACEPFKDFDYCVCRDRNRSSTSAYLINRFEVLASFMSILPPLLATESPALIRTPDDPLHDMILWERVGQFFQWKIGTLSDIVDGGTFDANMHDDHRGFIMEDVPGNPEQTTKKIHWEDSDPYFEPNDDFMVFPQHVKAHCIHCWGSYKTRTEELAKKLLS